MKLTEATEIINKLKDKELSFGCRVFENGHIHCLRGFHEPNNDFKIIWHPFTFWHAIDFLEKEYDLFSTEILENILNLWKDKRKDIEHPINEEAKLWFAKLVKETLITK